ncbi:hypothetical protein FDJ19_gp107 [Vibrio phage Ceto]|uniref:Uncharacterized protein n=1 Tax=Vibrio phage Ceto TaxID=2570300 RepID=A0A2H5BGR4_9CAUD|nr:hypothetical protein FDJ19_gp006 [Vibrio phage Ceto]YP_009621272.1 hypothetical protein FDJ19_gp107 [Vibrio phage Ceto]AUG85013.1 hypothetical protein CETO_6 [Vibrio phage Ceto]AUG85191.1 hypothetical protein CETO_209 [Vibrio phage Ceto]
MKVHVETLGQVWMCNIAFMGEMQYYTIPMAMKHVENTEFGQVWQNEQGEQFDVIEKLYQLEATW